MFRPKTSEDVLYENKSQIKGDGLEWLRIVASGRLELQGLRDTSAGFAASFSTCCRFVFFVSFATLAFTSLRR